MAACYIAFAGIQSNKSDKTESNKKLRKITQKNALCYSLKCYFVTYYWSYADRSNSIPIFCLNAKKYCKFNNFKRRKTALKRDNLIMNNLRDLSLIWILVLGVYASKYAECDNEKNPRRHAVHY